MWKRYTLKQRIFSLTSCRRGILQLNADYLVLFDHIKFPGLAINRIALKVEQILMGWVDGR